MHLRKAGLSDLALLQHWDQQPHVIACDPDSDWNWEQELDRDPVWRKQLIAVVDERPIGVLQIIDPAIEETHYWGDIQKGFRAIDIWIGESSDLGKGYGTTMMRLALDQCFSNSELKAVLVDPLARNTRAHRFYERLGFQFSERRRFGDEDCFVYCLRRDEFMKSSDH